MEQREIKFRTPKRTQLPNGGSELVYFSLEDLPDFKSDDLKKVILGLTQQYTGLKDKNGKEIYEGDIIKDNDGSMGYVLFKDGSFVVSNGKNDISNYRLIGTEENDIRISQEVIGNVYENPNLIK